VETVRGVEYGQVVIANKKVDENDVVLPLRKVIRVADERDRLIVEENQEAALSAFDVCQKKVNEHGLEMKLVDVEFTFDR
ncbi:PSP1 C-terminal domain-containing protein, partial [Streptomyces sp. MS2A]|nr:PSP1 C-terminal domain-containing protein [Streptomyces sp. MS2A]